MKTYQAFAKTKKNGQLINTEIQAKNMTEARKWFEKNTVKNEHIFLK